MADSSHRQRFQLRSGAESDGILVLRITPVGGGPRTTEAEIAEGTGEKAVTRELAEACTAPLPGDAFPLERDDRVDMLSKKRHGAAGFGPEIVNHAFKVLQMNRERGQADPPATPARPLVLCL